MATLRITQVRSTIGTKPKQRGTLRALGLRRINQTVAHFSDEVTVQNMELKRFLFENLYRHHKVDKMRVKAEIFITRLFETYLRFPNLLPPRYQARFDRSGLQRVVCDYIAGMTDRFALDEYRRIFEPYERV